MATDVTRVLSAIEQGDPHASEQLLPLVYEELRALAALRLSQERPGQTLQATALVHEAYLRLIGDDASRMQWDSRGHFFSAAAEAMRRILINRARDKQRLKRGQGVQRVNLDLDLLVSAETADEGELLSLDEALNALVAEDRLCGELVKLRFFAGLTLEDTARALGLSRRTADRYWAYARAWLFKSMQGRQIRDTDA
jgi:RNA polymerase sigma factor (TIGR02999 family)